LPVESSSKILGTRERIGGRYAAAGIGSSEMTDQTAHRAPNAMFDHGALKLKSFALHVECLRHSRIAGSLTNLPNVTDRGARVARVVHARTIGAMTAKAIGVHSHMHKTKVSRAVALLERRKLVTRRSNRRSAKILSPTAAGRKST
jgi:hypothetical protein